MKQARKNPLKARTVRVLLLLALLPGSLAVSASAVTVNGLFFGDGDLNDYTFLLADTSGNSKGKIYYKLDGTTAFFALVVGKAAANDSVFGDGAGGANPPDDQYLNDANWNKYEFAAAYGSDHATFGIECGATASTPDWSFALDLLYDLDGDQDPTEADWRGDQNGPDGLATSMPPSFTADTSIAWDMNNTSWDVTLGGTRPISDWKSPDSGPLPVPTTADGRLNLLDGYDLNDDSTLAGNWNSEYSWEWSLVYEFSFDYSSCTEGILINPGSSHNSPSKDGLEDTNYPPCLDDPPPPECGPLAFDWGDLPDSYGTLGISNGPLHLSSSLTNVYLGGIPDSENNGQPNSTATGDGGDEDGVVFTTAALVPGTVADITVTASGAGVLNAWIDFNSDGDFADPGEQIASDLAVVSGANVLDDVAVPTDATGIMAARFRITTAAGEGGGSTTGLATSGEVEDYVLTAIGDRVWNDFDSDGIQDAGEPGIAGVRVNLLDANGVQLTDGAGNDIFVLTDGSGNYEFPGLSPGSYRVEFVPPTGASFSPQNAGGDDSVDSDADGSGLAAFSSTLGATDDTIDAGLVGLFFDWGDLPDPSYPTLLASNGARHNITSVGNVFLNGGPDGESDGQPSATAAGDDSLSGDDEDGVVFLHPLVPGFSADIAVTASAAGFLSVYIDYNSDGDFADTNEIVLSDSPVAAGLNTLTIPTVSGGAIEPVPAGATGPMGARFRITSLSGQGGATATGAATTGEVEDYILAAIGNFVWNDSEDGDGVQDAGEPGVEGIVVHLLDSNGAPVRDAGGTEITTTTDENGFYEFPGLAPNSYRVRFELQGEFVDFSPPDQGGDDTNDSDAQQVTGTTPGLTPSVSLSAGDSDVDLDAGLRAPIAALITSATAYVDGGSVVFEFSTGYEALSAGFEVHRFDDAAGDYVPVTDSLMPALVGSPQGGVYRVADERAPLADKLQYVVVERQGDGRTRVYGPYTVAVSDRADREPLEKSFAALPQVSPRFAQRMAIAERPRREAASKAVGVGSNSVPGRGAGQQSLLIDVRETGLYYVSSSEMAAALGVPAPRVWHMVETGRIAVENAGEPTAWMPAGASGQGLYFYGEAIDSLYTLDNTYRLRMNEPGVRMGSVEEAYPSAAPGGTFASTERFAEEVIPAITSTLETGVDYWYWTGINAAGSDTVRTFEVVVPDAVDGPASLTVRFYGATNGSAVVDHHAVVRVGGVEIGSAAWGGMETREVTLPFDSSLLAPQMTIEVEGTLAGGSTESIFFIDGFDLEYQRAYRAVDDRLLVTGDGNSVVTVEGFTGADLLVFDVTDPAAPLVVRNVRVEMGSGGFQASFEPATAETPYFVTAVSSAPVGDNLRLSAPAIDLKAPYHSYEHVVIAPEAWRPEAESLALYRTNEGIDSLAVSIEDVYEAFSDGIVTPWAIRDFLTYARENWSQGPDFALLAGRGTFDPRDILGGGDNFVPVVLVGTPHGLQSSDNVLADLAGGDAIPEVAIGRLPIVSAGELATYVDKLEAYASSTGAWRDRALLLADNPDTAGDFTSQSDDVAALLGSYGHELVYLSEMTPAEARVALQSAWNEGAQLVNYIGHGGVGQLAAENLLGVGDMGALANGDRLPIVSALTCVVGRSDVPNFESLAEALVTDADGGAIAVWAPSGLSISGVTHQLNMLYVTALEGAEAGAPFGDLVLETLGAFGAAGGSEQMLNAYGITGDPAVALP